MKASRLTLLLLVIALFGVLQIACAPAENTNVTVTNANMATPTTAPDKTAITAEITKIENDWPRIIKDRDAAAVRKIEADDIVIVYPDGTLGGKEQDVKDIEAGNLSYDSWEISELNVSVIDNDAAVASLRITVKNGKYKTPDGKSQNISGQYRSVDTFARRNGQWQLVGSATTPMSPQAGATASPKASPAASSSPAMKASPAPKAAPTRKPGPPPPAKTP